MGQLCLTRSTALVQRPKMTLGTLFTRHAHILVSMQESRRLGAMFLASIYWILRLYNGAWRSTVTLVNLHRVKNKLDIDGYEMRSHRNLKSLCRCHPSYDERSATICSKSML
ncbi:hypothetical protein NW759_016443 [Fusarium solani]|nr:hypothetical protein NW759_016443 [Fusarium solani]